MSKTCIKYSSPLYLHPKTRNLKLDDNVIFFVVLADIELIYSILLLSKLLFNCKKASSSTARKNYFTPVLPKPPLLLSLNESTSLNEIGDCFSTILN